MLHAHSRVRRSFQRHLQVTDSAPAPAQPLAAVLAGGAVMAGGAVLAGGAPPSRAVPAPEEGGSQHAWVGVGGGGGGRVEVKRRVETRRIVGVGVGIGARVVVGQPLTRMVSCSSSLARSAGLNRSRSLHMVSTFRGRED
jgi:hypothetical protein